MEEQPQAWIIEQLDTPIHYINGQWAATGYGIKCITSPYEIKKADLADVRREDATMPQWPRHMAKIGWVNTGSSSCIRSGVESAQYQAQLPAGLERGNP